MDTNAKQMKVVWMIVERGDKSFWSRIGVGFVNRDGSVNLQLDAVPAVPGAKIQIRDYTPKDADDGDAPSSGEAGGGERRQHNGGSFGNDAARAARRDQSARRDNRSAETAP